MRERRRRKRFNKKYSAPNAGGIEYLIERNQNVIKGTE